MQQLVELRRVDARHRLLARDQSFVDHVDGGLHRGGGRALRRARLQEIELVVLDGELDVLHVAVVLLEPPHRFEQLLERRGQLLFHLRERLRRADAGDDVLALRVGEELAVETRLAGRRITRERDAGARLVALVAEDHLHDVDRGAELVGDVVRARGRPGARRVPRIEDRLDRARQLVARILRKVSTRSPPR